MIYRGVRSEGGGGGVDCVYMQIYIHTYIHIYQNPYFPFHPAPLPRASALEVSSLVFSSSHTYTHTLSLSSLLSSYLPLTYPVPSTLQLPPPKFPNWIWDMGSDCVRKVMSINRYLDTWIPGYNR